MINKTHLWQETFTGVDLKGGICELNPSGVLLILIIRSKCCYFTVKEQKCGLLERSEKHFDH